MVKVADLGYKSSNLQDIPSKEEKKEQSLLEALSNLTRTPLPSSLSLSELPDSLYMLGE